MSILMSGKQKPYYIIGERVYAKVTRILSVFQDPEFKREVDRETLEETIGIGTKVHKFIEMDVKGKPSKAKYHGYQIESCLKAYKNWKETRKPLEPKGELLIWSDSLGIAGTIDHLDLKGFITDFKTGYKLLYKNRLQVNTYISIYDEWMKGQPLDMQLPVKGRLVRLDKTLSIFEEEIFSFNGKLWEVFMSIKDVYEKVYGQELVQAEAELIGGKDGEGDATTT